MVIYPSSCERWLREWRSRANWVYLMRWQRRSSHGYGTCFDRCVCVWLHFAFSSLVSIRQMRFSQFNPAAAKATTATTGWFDANSQIIASSDKLPYDFLPFVSTVICWVIDFFFFSKFMCTHLDWKSEYYE